MQKPLNWECGFFADLAADDSGLWTLRRLSQMKNIFADKEAVLSGLETGDPVIYQFQQLCVPEDPGDIAFGLTKLMPGTVGREYYMTKGHFHAIPQTGEVYFTLRGEGYLLIENAEGSTQALPLKPGQAAYAAKGYAHRSVNTGREPLVMFWAYRGDAGHDYAAIEHKGFRKLIVEENGQPTVVPNPKWV